MLTVIESFPAKMIRLSTIGPIAVHVDDTRVPATNDLIVAALLFLTVERGKPVSRRHFAQMFFPNADADASAHSGRQLVYRLRKLGVHLIGDASSITLPENSAVWDVDVLMDRGSASPTELQALEKGYLVEYAHHQSPEFAKWLDEHKDEVAAKARNLLVRQIQAVRSKKDFRSLEGIARACLALDPLNEEATLAAAESLAAVGAKAEAIQLLDQYLDDVGTRSNDLRVAPRLLRERISGYAAEPDREMSTLIGRDDELAALGSLVEKSAAGNAAGCFVSGPAGIGKTRLLDEACTIANLTGHAVARVRLSRFDAGRPFAVLGDLAPALLDMRGAIGASPETLAAVKGLCGRGPSQYFRRPTNELDSRAVSADVVRKVVELVSAIAEEQPLVICVEDADRIDEASLQLIVEILEACQRVCVFLATRRRMAIPERLSSRLTVTRMALGPLAAEQADLVVASLFHQANRSVNQEFASNAVRVSAGVPLFLHLLFKNYLATGNPDALPATLSASLNARLRELKEPAKSVFDAVVVLGKHSTVQRLEALTELPRYSLTQALRFLEDEGFLRISEATVGASHELLATAAQRQMPGSVAKLLHTAAATTLEAEHVPAIDPLEIAMHWEACGERSRAMVVLMRSADTYTRLGRPHEAIRLLTGFEQPSADWNGDKALDLTLFEACHAAGEDHQGIAVARRLGLLNGEGSADKRIMAMEMLLGAGQAVVPYAGEVTSVAGDRTHPSALRGRAARLIVVIADDLANEALAKEALVLIGDLDPVSLHVLMPTLMVEAVFGSSLRTIELATKVFDLATELDASGPKLQAMLTASMALLRIGELSGIAYCEHAYGYARDKRIWSAATSFASMLSQRLWEAGDIAAAAVWHERTTESLNNSGGPDRGFQHLSMAVNLSLESNDLARAQWHLERAERLYPRILADRMRSGTLAIRLRIKMGFGQTPSHSEIDELIRVNRPRQSHGGNDEVADTVVAALRMVGCLTQADEFRDEYLARRREPLPVPVIFRNLNS